MKTDAEKELDEERVNLLFNFLQGELPQHVTVAPESIPHLSAQSAKSVLWFLQEICHFAPDEYEVCARCSTVFNKDAEGFWTDEESLKDHGYTLRVTDCKDSVICDECGYVVLEPVTN